MIYFFKVKAKFELGSLLVTLLFLILSWFIPDFKNYQYFFSSTTIPEPTQNSQVILVTKVIDGDTIELSTGERVRYIGIDTPERAECYFQEAKLANEKLVLNQTVKLVKDVSQADRYGRLLRYVYVNGIFVNNYLVKEGYAFASTYPPDVNYQELFLQSQKQAREKQKGFWAEGICEQKKL